MKLSTALSLAVVACISHLSLAASSWGFNDASISLQGKGSGSGLKEKLTENQALKKPIELDSDSTLKILLTTQEGKSAKRPHQAFLSLSDPTTGLETSFPFSVKESGKAKVDLARKDIPSQLLQSTEPLTASLIIASFGSSKPYNSKAFDLSIKLKDTESPASNVDKPLRYGQLPEIHHIFRADAKSPPAIISLVFAVAVLATIPVLFGCWLFLGANLNHATKAFSEAPIAHGLFFGSILAIEGLFFLYYTTWNLFQTLPFALALGSMIFLSGSRALTEVQERRFAGLR